MSLSGEETSCVGIGERTKLRLTHNQSPSYAILRVTTIERSHCNWFTASGYYVFHIGYLTIEDMRDPIMNGEYVDYKVKSSQELKSMQKSIIAFGTRPAQHCLGRLSSNFV